MWSSSTCGARGAGGAGVCCVLLCRVLGVQQNLLGGEGRLAGPGPASGSAASMCSAACMAPCPAAAAAPATTVHDLQHPLAPPHLGNHADDLRVVVAEPGKGHHYVGTVHRLHGWQQRDGLLGQDGGGTDVGCLNVGSELARHPPDSLTRACYKQRPAPTTPRAQAHARTHTRAHAHLCAQQVKHPPVIVPDARARPQGGGHITGLQLAHRVHDQAGESGHRWRHKPARVARATAHSGVCMCA